MAYHIVQSLNKIEQTARETGITGEVILSVEMEESLFDEQVKQCRAYYESHKYCFEIAKGLNVKLILN